MGGEIGVNVGRDERRAQRINKKIILRPHY